MMKSNTIKDAILDQFSQRAELCGIIAVPNNNGWTVLAEGSDLMLILIYQSDIGLDSFNHYMKDGVRIHERRMMMTELRDRIEKGDDRTAIQWVLQGEIWVDREAELEGLRTKLQEYPAQVQEQKLLFEFSMFLKRYMQCKEHLQMDQILDAYTSILRALHHWARIVIIEEGVYPDVTVWKQVKQMNPGVYKLYEELTTSAETLKQRVELVMLACEFSVMSKMESCCRPIIRFLETSGKPLSISEMLDRQDLFAYMGHHLPLILNRLAKKSLIKEVAVTETGDLSSMQLKYTK